MLIGLYWTSIAVLPLLLQDQGWSIKPGAPKRRSCGPHLRRRGQQKRGVKSCSSNTIVIYARHHCVVVVGDAGAAAQVGIEHIGFSPAMLSPLTKAAAGTPAGTRLRSTCLLLACQQGLVHLDDILDVPIDWQSYAIAALRLQAESSSDGNRDRSPLPVKRSLSAIEDLTESPSHHDCKPIESALRTPPIPLLPAMPLPPPPGLFSAFTSLSLPPPAPPLRPASSSSSLPSIRRTTSDDSCKSSSGNESSHATASTRSSLASTAPTALSGTASKESDGKQE